MLKLLTEESTKFNLDEMMKAPDKESAEAVKERFEKGRSPHLTVRS